MLSACTTTKIDYNTKVDETLQQQVEAINNDLRAKYGLSDDQADVGVYDLTRNRVAMIHPDKGEYAASVAKVGILLAYFELHKQPLDSQTRHELGLMCKASSNEMATKFSREMGIPVVQQVLNKYHFYDVNRGGGIWFGKHYGAGGDRVGDPLADDSHAVTVRQLLRFWSMLDRGALVSRQASQTMKELFASPDIPHDDLKFVKGLAGRDVQILRKWGTWEDWLHDSALITGPNRRYILVGLTHHPRGDEYLAELAQRVDDLLR